MFKNPFSFEGRIRRTEYAISFIILVAINLFFTVVEEPAIQILLWVPLCWFIIAQSAKHCHDTGTSGWYQLIPFYVFYLLLVQGDPGENEYGEDPKIKMA